ncbi:MAG: capsule biosynthesis protein [Chlorobium sp.]|nr:MAG: capsule biosynthesis protein [Chlorobium sp.]
MRLRYLLLLILCFLTLPACLSALERSGSASESALSDKMGIPAITSITSISEARQSAQQESTGRQDEHQQVIQGNTVTSKSRFQSYVERATGSSLEVFGRELFSNVPSTYAPLGAVQVNADYVIGAGDALQIRGWGMVDIDLNVLVSRNGEIYLPRVGSVQVAGVKYRDLQGYLKKAVGKIFTNFELSVSIAKTRSVQIYVMGHAQRPGTYTLSAMSTLLNVLFASGGPAVTGSMRNIKLKRGSERLVSFDLYDILLSGDKSADMALQDGDVIFIPAVGQLVALLGDVKKPAIFELQQKTSIADVVRWAGGFESAANLKKVIIEKSIDNRYTTIAEIESDWASIEGNLAKLEVQPTDIIRVFAPGASPMEVKMEREFVRVDGEVKHNGVFEIQKGETLRALISRIGGITDKGYVYGTRLNRESVRRDQQLKINEAVDRYEKDIEVNTKQRLASESDPARLAVIANEQESQRRLAQKLRAVKSEGRIILNLKDASVTANDLPEFPLKDGDMVYIPQKQGVVDVIGAVYQQNTFMHQPNRSAHYYIKLAGGVNTTGEKSEIYRICMDGTVRSNRFGGLGGTVNPGDAIVVPEKMKHGTGLMQGLKDFTTVLYQFGLGAAGLKTLQN